MGRRSTRSRVPVWRWPSSLSRHTKGTSRSLPTQGLSPRSGSLAALVRGDVNATFAPVLMRKIGDDLAAVDNLGVHVCLAISSTPDQARPAAACWIGQITADCRGWEGQSRSMAGPGDVPICPIPHGGKKVEGTLAFTNATPAGHWQGALCQRTRSCAGRGERRRKPLTSFVPADWRGEKYGFGGGQEDEEKGRMR